MDDRLLGREGLLGHGRRNAGRLVRHRGLRRCRGNRLRLRGRRLGIEFVRLRPAAGDPKQEGLLSDTWSNGPSAGIRRPARSAYWRIVFTKNRDPPLRPMLWAGLKPENSTARMQESSPLTCHEAADRQHRLHRRGEAPAMARIHAGPRPQGELTEALPLAGFEARASNPLWP
jgi:hypothetical protein